MRADATFLQISSLQPWCLLMASVLDLDNIN